MTNHKKRKVRGSKTSEDNLRFIAEKLTERFYSALEIRRLSKEYGYTGSREMLFSLLVARGFLITEETISPEGKLVVYKVITEADYEKYDEEVHENARKRLLETVSYKSAE